MKILHEKDLHRLWRLDLNTSKVQNEVGEQKQTVQQVSGAAISGFGWQIGNNNKSSYEIHDHPKWVNDRVSLVRM